VSEMVDFKAVQDSGITKLHEWRNRYDKREYPEKIVINIFYDIFAIEGVWNELTSTFTGVKRASDFNTAYQNVVNLKRDYQVRSLNQNLLLFIRQDKPVCDTKYSDWSEDIKLASNGDNASVVELEYSYWFYNQYGAATLMWAACGSLGLNKRQAFQQISGGDLGDFKADTFAEIVQSFASILGVVFDGYQDYQGNPVSNASIYGGGNIKYYPKSFKIPPKLW
jgi:hypothetical protein